MAVDVGAGGEPLEYTVSCFAEGFLIPEDQTAVVYEATRIGTEVNFVLEKSLPEPTGLMATGWDGQVDLEWIEPFIPAELLWDNTNIDLTTTGIVSSNRSPFPRLSYSYFLTGPDLTGVFASSGCKPARSALTMINSWP